MAGRYEEAEKLFKDSLDIFTKLDQSEKYSLCIAAVYNYMGEIKRHKQEYSQALVCYDQAIAISKDKEVISSLAIFHTNAGQAAFENQDFKKAKIYFKKAMELYSQFDNHWGRSTAEGFSAMLLIRNGQYHKALSCLRRADLYAQKLKSPYELSLVQRVKTDITAIMNKDRRLKDIFSHYLQTHKNLP
jgi:tetratricopeptide (TPR) repeat protein